MVAVDGEQRQGGRRQAPPHLEPLMEPLSDDQLWWIRPAPPDPDD